MYDLLETMGLVHKTQGRGTFVSSPESQPPAVSSTKEQALSAIDTLLNHLEDLSFPLRDIRIYLELKLRQREETPQHVRVGAVDCSPEALSVSVDQLSALDGVDVYEYLLNTVLEAPTQFSPGMDLLFTTHTHFPTLSAKLSPGQQLTQISMSLSPSTVLKLARIPADTQVGIVCASPRFAQIIRRSCDKYCATNQPLHTTLLSDAPAFTAILATCPQLILPPNYHRFCTPAQREALKTHASTHPHIIYQYQIERGSLLHLQQEIARISTKKNAQL